MTVLDLSIAICNAAERIREDHRMYRELEPDKIVETTRKLHQRILERFPDSGLSRVAAEVVDVGDGARAQSRRLRRRNLPLRFGAWLLLLAGLGAVGYLVANAEFTDAMWRVENLLEEMNAALGSIVFLGAAAIFLLTIEHRLRRRKALAAVHELRVLSHIVDMHQLTKDPEPILILGPRTASSPERKLTSFELSRYLDYCSEMLSLLSKLAALYARGLTDPVVLQAVDDVENLTSGLSRKIWQKVIILDRFFEASKGTEAG